MREGAESTKLRIVYDASAKPNSSSPSLNECLEVGPPLQNLIWDVAIRNRLRPVALTGDIKQAFLQIRIREKDRDALRFHWVKDPDNEEVETLRFTRVMFGLGPSPFILGATLQHHLEEHRQTYPEAVEELMKNLYVDDIIGGGATEEDVQQFKDAAIEIFKEAGFELHKWHSNYQTWKKPKNRTAIQEKLSPSNNSAQCDLTQLYLEWHGTRIMIY